MCVVLSQAARFELCGDGCVGSFGHERTVVCGLIGCAVANRAVLDGERLDSREVRVADVVADLLRFSRNGQQHRDSQADQYAVDSLHQRPPQQAASRGAVKWRSARNLPRVVRARWGPPSGGPNWKSCTRTRPWQPADASDNNGTHVFTERDHIWIESCISKYLPKTSSVRRSSTARTSAGS